MTVAADSFPDRARDLADYLEDIEPPSPFATMLPRMVKMAPIIGAMGFVTVFSGLGVGVWRSDQLGKALDPRSGPPPRTEFLADAMTTAPWLGPLQLLGLGMMLFGISVTVLGIAVVLRNMGLEASDVFLRASGQETEPPTAEGGARQTTGDASPGQGASG